MLYESYKDAGFGSPRMPGGSVWLLRRTLLMTVLF
jgi:hypothetical protein